jgi:hypothetical protein
MNSISWLLAALIFLCFSVIFVGFGRDPIRSFAVRERFDDEENVETPGQKRIEAFLKDFDGYLKSINARNRFRYYVAAGGFLVAALVCLLLATVWWLISIRFRYLDLEISKEGYCYWKSRSINLGFYIDDRAWSNLVVLDPVQYPDIFVVLNILVAAAFCNVID